MGRLLCTILFLLIPAFTLFPDSPRLLASETSPIAALIGRQDGAILIDPKGKVVFSKNADLLLIPASTLKILTSLVALHYLGPDYRCITEFYIDPSSNLMVKGYGDPLLTSEVLTEITDRLVSPPQILPHIVDDLVLDPFFFSRPLKIPGIAPSAEPYDSPNGALNVNFNTVSFTQDSQGNYISGEPQTPLTAYALKQIRSTGLKAGRILLTSGEDEATLYTGHLMRYFLGQKGVKIHGRIRIGKVDPEKDRRIYTHKSRHILEEVVSKLLEFSNNYMANQILILMGTRVHGPSGTLEKGRQAMSAYAAAKLGIKQIQLIEGSGISRKNRLSVGQMAAVLKAFEPHHHLLRKAGREFYKTGTLRGIHTRAGYLRDGTGGLYRFAVFINTPGKRIDDIMNHIRKMAWP